MKNIIIIGILLISITIFGQARKYSNEFLNIGVDAAAMAMGNAVTATVSDVTAGYWNPAGLMHVDNRELGLMHAAYFANIAQYEYAGFAMPLDKNSALGITAIRFGVDDIMDTTELINSQGEVVWENINLFSAADYALQVSYARKPLLKDFYWGMNAKMIYRRIGKFASAFGFGLDAGFQYQNENWFYGVMLRDITTTYNVWNIDQDALNKIKQLQPSFNQSEPESTEMTLPKAQIGIGKKWDFHRDFGLLTNVDLNVYFAQTNDIISSSAVSMSPSLGIQADYLEMIYLRLGVNNFQKETNFDQSQSVTFQPNVGVGFQYKGIAVDYALTNIASIGNVQYSNIFSLKMDIDETFR